MGYKIFVINPGSTSTKLAYFDGMDKLFEESVTHDAAELARFHRISDQFDYRFNIIVDFLKENNIDLTGVDAIVGRGGGAYPEEGGVYEITDLLVEHSMIPIDGIEHPATLGVPLADKLHKKFGGRAFMVDSPASDELQDLARITGIKGQYRPSAAHALNIKGTLRKYCREHGLKYEDGCFIGCHVDGGISITAHDHGRMIDTTSSAQAEGPFTPTRTGTHPFAAVLDMVEAGLAAQAAGTYDATSAVASANTYDIANAVAIDGNAALNKEQIETVLHDLRDMTIKSGGFVSYFGTSDSDEVHAMVEQGDPEASLVWEAMGYNICKAIGSMATVLSGKVDAIVLGGRLLRFDDLCQRIRDRCEWIAPVFFYPGEVEHEAMAHGALMVLNGEIEPKIYSGHPVWSGFEWDK